MGRELTPEKNTLLVEQLLVEQVMWLMSLAEGIEASMTDLFDAWLLPKICSYSQVPLIKTGVSFR